MALLLAAAACGARGPTAAPSGAAGSVEARAGSMSSDAVPKFFPNYTKPCASEELPEVMHSHFNPALSQMSNALFHAPEAEDRMDRVADAAAIILGCTEDVEKLRPADISEREWITFDHFLIQLVMNTHALQTAALEDEPEVVVHWFHHVKQTCAGCHARFRED